MTRMAATNQSETRKYEVWEPESDIGLYKFSLCLFKNKNHAIYTTKHYKTLERAISVGEKFLDEA